MKRILAILLAVAMLLSMGLVSATAEELVDGKFAEDSAAQRITAVPPPMTKVRSPSAIWAASSGLWATSTPSGEISCRDKTILRRLGRGLPPGKSARVLRPTMTVAPAVVARKNLRSAETATGWVPSQPMPQSSYTATMASMAAPQMAMGISKGKSLHL